MNDDIRLGVDKVCGLRLNRFNNFGMTMTCVRHAYATGEIEELAPIVGIDVRAFGVVSHEVENATPGRRHVGEVFGVELTRHDFPF
jgi:hypothetical protein